MRLGLRRRWRTLMFGRLGRIRVQGRLMTGRKKILMNEKALLVRKI